MKNKIILLCLILCSVFIFVGCENTKEEPKKETKKVATKDEKEKEKYLKYVKKLKGVKESTEDLPFTVEVLYEKIESEVRYQVIIDNPTKEIKDVEAIATHNKQTDDVFPSVGIFDDKVNLIPEQKPSGVILVGYIPYSGKVDDLEVEMKVLITYKIDDKEYTSYYVTKK